MFFLRRLLFRCLSWSAVAAVAVGAYWLGGGTGVAREDAFTPRAVTLREAPGTGMKELREVPLRFTDAAGVPWTAPVGTLTDGASVPRAALWVGGDRFDEAVLKAAILHDAYCQRENADRCPEQYRTRRWEEVHRMFHEALLAGGTAPRKANTLFAAVWLAGPTWPPPQGPDLSAPRIADVVPPDRLAAEFDRCRAFIDREDPTREQLEDWMTARAVALAAGAAPPAAAAPDRPAAR